MNKDYRPISCAEHERLEFAVLRRFPITLWLTEGGSLTGQAVDVFTRDGAEWLRLREPTGTEHVLRLDKIRKVQMPEGET
ncbi:MAG: hypothetical protein K6T56_04460 [Burkholderiales bacterium]|nr:hypothetical protein [Burkholderiales bacterium]